MTYDYYDIFTVHENGTVSSDFAIRVQNVTMKPGTVFRPGAPFAGFDIAMMAGHEIKGTIHEENGNEVVVLEKFL